MRNTTKTSQAPIHLTFTLSPGQSRGDIPASPQAQSRTPAEALPTFPVSAIALDAHPRESAWAGLSEAGQILSEAEARKGEALTLPELRQLQMAHLDAYDPDWSFAQRGISDAWMSGWEHAFALYAQQITRLCDPEGIHGIGLVFGPHAAPSPTDQSPKRQTVLFRNARIQVVDPDAFWQGVWEGQLAALDEQDAWQEMRTCWGGAQARPLTAARFFDNLLDLFYETGNHGLDFLVGYIMGLSEGLLSGRMIPPVQTKRHSA